MIWSMACMPKFQVMNSTMGRRPAIAAPTPMPAKPCSAVAFRSTTFSWRNRRDSSSCRTCMGTRLTARNGFSNNASAPRCGACAQLRPKRRSITAAAFGGAIFLAAPTSRAPSSGATSPCPRRVGRCSVAGWARTCRPGTSAGSRWWSRTMPTACCLVASNGTTTLDR